jgi:hypothetical protein
MGRKTPGCQTSVLKGWHRREWRIRSHRPEIQLGQSSQHAAKRRVGRMDAVWLHAGAKLVNPPFTQFHG